MRAIYNHARFHILRDTIYAPTAADVVIDARFFFSFFLLFFNHFCGMSVQHILTHRIAGIEQALNEKQKNTGYTITQTCKVIHHIGFLNCIMYELRWMAIIKLKTIRRVKKKQIHTRKERETSKHQSIKAFFYAAFSMHKIGDISILFQNTYNNSIESNGNMMCQNRVKWNVYSGLVWNDSHARMIFSCFWFKVKENQTNVIYDLKALFFLIKWNTWQKFDTQQTHKHSSQVKI